MFIDFMGELMFPERYFYIFLKVSNKVKSLKKNYLIGHF